MNQRTTHALVMNSPSPLRRAGDRSRGDREGLRVEVSRPQMGGWVVKPVDDTRFG